jgi:hypothetical protein
MADLLVGSRCDGGSHLELNRNDDSLDPHFVELLVETDLPRLGVDDIGIA